MPRWLRRAGAPLALAAILVLALVQVNSARKAAAATKELSAPLARSLFAPETDGAVASLTGEVVDRRSAAGLRGAYAVRLSNASVAQRFLTGVDEADVVFEEPTDDGFSSLLAIFHQSVPENVGPLAAALPSDDELGGFVPMREVASGMDSAFQEQFSADSVPLVLPSSKLGSLAISRSETIEAPFEYSVNLDALQREVGPEEPPTAPWLFLDADETPAGDATSQIEVQVGEKLPVVWQWDENEGRWMRTVGASGQAQRVSGGVQLSAANVLIMDVKAASMDQAVRSSKSSKVGLRHSSKSGRSRRVPTRPCSQARSTMDSAV